MLFKERVRALRKERGETQVQVAAAIGIAEQHYQRMEKGKINIPTLTLYDLADYFDVTADYLLGRSEER